MPFSSRLIVVGDRLQEERRVDCRALSADPLDKGLLDRVDLRIVERIVVEQDLDRIRAGLDQAAHAPLRQQVGQAALDAHIIAGLLVGQQHARARRASLDRL